MKNRKALAEYFSKREFNIGAEIGVLGGSYSIMLCEANPKLQLSCIDSWGINDGRHGEYHTRKFYEAQQRLNPYNAKLIRKTSLDAVNDFEDKSLDFVYIDANHSFDNIMCDIIEWSRKVKKGGIISGHDYADGVKDAIDMYAKWHALKVEVTQEKDKGNYSWWVTI